MNDKQPKSSRNCPALARTITPKECGSERVSKLDCPASCAFHPFTKENAAGMAELEERLLRKVQKRVLDEMGAKGREFARTLREAEDEVEQFLLLTQAVHAGGEKEGQDFFERWRKAGLNELNNDERTLLQAQRTQRPALLKIERVIDAWSMEVLDLLDADTKGFTVVADVELDPSMKGDVLLAWIYDAPLFMRMSGPAFQVPEDEAGDALAGLLDLAQSMEDGPRMVSQLRAWLTAHMLDVYEALAEGEEEETSGSVETVLDMFDWSELPDFSSDPMPRQKVIREQEIEDRLSPFMHKFQDAEEAVQWFEEAWPDIASGVDQITEGVLSDEGFGVVLILLAKGAAVLHPRPPQRERTDSMRFVWQLGNELRESSRIAEEEAFEQYIQDSPQPAVCEWLCGEAVTFSEGEEPVFDQENLAIVFPVLKAAIWEMCHLPQA